MTLGRHIAFILASVLAAGPAAPDEVDDSFRRPDTIPFPEDAPYDPRIATLGKMLFFDPRLSGGQNMSCASCHNPSFGWETPVAGAIGSHNRPLARHAPTTVNMAWVSPYFWDGRAASLEEQAAGPITAEVEMNATFEEVISRLSRVDGYRDWFGRLFPGEGITQATITRAIATFERTIVSGIAPFDRWVEGDDDAVSEDVRRGFALFTGAANCVACHSGWNFTDNRFHDIGLATGDPGRSAVDATDPGARHAFKTPGLRNVALRAPFMHDGQVETLDAVVRHYVEGGIDRPSRSPLVHPLDLSENDVSDLVAFLVSLTEERTVVPAPVLPAN